MANVLIIGSGGREHAIARKFSESKHVETVYVAPGNLGMCDVATIVDIKQNDFAGLINFVKYMKIDLTFVGPEIPLCEGIVDAFKLEGLTIFGPKKNAARLEGSKIFSKYMMQKYHIPTANYKTFDNVTSAIHYLDTQKFPIVIKADGLAQGKGVIICQNKDEAISALEDMMCNSLFKDAGKSVVIEEFLDGEEFSLLAFVHNDIVIPMQIAQDHKRAFDNDEGLNTGGMGAYTPVKHIPQSAIDDAVENIIKKMADAMISEKCPFTGILYGGCMLCEDGVKTIEYNVRFGDPETEVLLLALESDLYEVIMNLLEGKSTNLIWSNDAYCGVVMANNGYPESYTSGAVIEGLDDVDSIVFHMGTKLVDNNFVTSGGRVLFVADHAPTLLEAQQKVYKEINKIKCDSLFYRKDIGSRGV